MTLENISAEQVHEMAAAAGLVLDDDRARTIASRLSGVLAELAMISDDELSTIEPAPSFVPRIDGTDA